KKSFFILLSFLIFISSQSFAQQLNSEEKKLYDLIMQYRKEYNLPHIPLSPSLTKVAQLHVKDLGDNNPVTDECNLHSWSNKGNWTPVCYTDDHKQAQLMWSKPREITSYKGKGYEISYATTADEVDAASALNTWKGSVGHNKVIINEGSWKNMRWNAIGIGIYKGYAVVWFGQEKDEN